MGDFCAVFFLTNCLSFFDLRSCETLVQGREALSAQASGVKDKNEKPDPDALSELLGF